METCVDTDIWELCWFAWDTNETSDVKVFIQISLLKLVKFFHP